MQQVEEYRRQAQECRALAARAKSESIRRELLELAKRWCGLAQQREAFLARHRGSKKDAAN
jgi:hypothetical protein